ncbi:MAG: single-stranded-DNA-specific exonuclease RecJ [Candidatus Dormibacteria bacterium]
MKPAPRHWEINSRDSLPGLSPVLGRVLAARGYDRGAAASLLDTAETFHDPAGLAGMTEAVAVIGDVLRQGRRIAVYGDYDVDGVTACALLTRALRGAGADVVPYIPNRMSEGYGLHAAALEELAGRGVECVITVDCGTSSVDVASARPAGMRLIITDHHLPLAPDGSPPALAAVDALINPKQPACSYPFDALAGAGVAWKLLQALEASALVPAGSAAGGVGLAALGTVCDMMPLRGENRCIVSRGLQSLDQLPGIQALREVAGIRGALRASDLAFGIGPRINAAGRMEDAQLALDLCLSGDLDDARPLAVRLDRQNVVRRQAVATALADAEERVAALPDDAPAIVLGDSQWPMGIVGLVAGRLAERFARPAFIVCLDPTEAKGSTRSVPGVHIVRALDGAAAALRRYGGHAAAAGFSLDAERFEDFSARVSEAVAQQLAGSPRRRTFAIDTDVTCAEVTVELCRELDALEPCGQGNHQPLLALRGCRVVGTSAFGTDRQHVRLILGDDAGMVEAIAFNKPHLEAHLPRGRRIDACIALELDIWDGAQRVRGRLRDLRPTPLRPELDPQPAGLEVGRAAVVPAASFTAGRRGASVLDGGRGR